MGIFAWYKSSNRRVRSAQSRNALRARPARLKPGIEWFEARCLLSGSGLGVAGGTLDAVTQTRIAGAYGQIPLSFEANVGQTDAQVNFVSRGNGYALFLTPD